ncbi:MAG: hypothetical protein JRN06_02015 [Nitrososphaerota archaeon]|nr:hypothetical protein [Nitrososphaerota archaeon]MDG7023369.1 hypothetical protein [Nitrososphaerota archaeon]
MKSHFGHETGLRILAGALAREGAKLDIGIEPVFAHSTRHYLRLYVRTSPGAAAADESIRRLGHLTWCLHCGHVASSRQEEPVCPSCGKKAKTAGPLWVDGLADYKVVATAADFAERIGSAPAARLIRSLEGVNEFPSWSFSIEGASSSLRAATVPEPLIRRLLLEKGWRVMRTPFERTGLKTNAPYQEFQLAAEMAIVSGRRSP